MERVDYLPYSAQPHSGFMHLGLQLSPGNFELYLDGKSVVSTADIDSHGGCMVEVRHTDNSPKLRGYGDYHSGKSAFIWERSLKVGSYVLSELIAPASDAENGMCDDSCHSACDPGEEDCAKPWCKDGGEGSCHSHGDSYNNDLSRIGSHGADCYGYDAYTVSSHRASCNYGTDCTNCGSRNVGMGSNWGEKISHIKITGEATCKATLYQSADLGYSSHWTVAWRQKNRVASCLIVAGNNTGLNGEYVQAAERTCTYSTCYDYYPSYVRTDNSMVMKYSSNGWNFCNATDGEIDGNCQNVQGRIGKGSYNDANHNRRYQPEADTTIVSDPEAGSDFSGDSRISFECSLNLPPGVGKADYTGFYEFTPKAKTFQTQAEAEAFYSDTEYSDTSFSLHSWPYEGSASGKVIFDNFLAAVTGWPYYDWTYTYGMHSQMGFPGISDKEKLRKVASDLHGGWMESYTVASTDGGWVAVPHANEAAALTVDIAAACPACSGRTTPYVRPTKAKLFVEHPGDVSTSPDGEEAYRLKGDLHALNVWAGAPSAAQVQQRFLASRKQLAASSGDHIYDQWRKAASFLVADAPMCSAEWCGPRPATVAATVVVCSHRHQEALRHPACHPVNSACHHSCAQVGPVPVDQWPVPHPRADAQHLRAGAAADAALALLPALDAAAAADAAAAGGSTAHPADTRPPPLTAAAALPDH